MKRSATAVWQGTGKEGKGKLSTASGVLNSSQYTWSSRFENATGTNPEELIAAAHAGCFSMKLAFLITKAGFTPDQIETSCELDHDPPKGEITDSRLTVKVKAKGLDDKKFQELAEDAKVNCPVSRLLKCNISMEAKLE